MRTAVARGGRIGGARIPARRRFDVTPRCRCAWRLFEVGEREFVLVLVVHHISGDGSSVGPLTRDLMTAYVARARARRPPGPRWRCSTRTTACGSVRCSAPRTIRTRSRREQVAYWRRALDGLPDQLDLPADRSRPAVAVRSRAARSTFASTPRRMRALADWRARHGATLFMVVHTALAVLLARLSGTDDIAIGTPFAGRGERRARRPDRHVRQYPGAADPGRRAVRRSPICSARQVSRDIAAFAHADVPFERLVEVLNPERSTRGIRCSRWADVPEPGRTTMELPGLSLSGVDFDTQVSQFDLHLTCSGRVRRCGAPPADLAEFTYATDLFDAAHGCRVRRPVRALARARSSRRRRAPVGDVELLDDVERDRSCAGLERHRAPCRSASCCWTGIGARWPHTRMRSRWRSRVTS